MNQADDNTPCYPIPDTPLQRQMAIGHRRRTGHELTGYLIPTNELTGYLIPTNDDGVLKLVRTCCEESKS